MFSQSVCSVVILSASIVVAAAQERDRTKIPDQYKWNLTDLYASDAAWRTAKEKLTASIPSLSAYQGKLLSSASTLASALEQIAASDKELSRLYAYASLLADQDTRDSSHQGMRQEMVQLAAEFSARTAYLEPEILRIKKETLAGFLASEPRLKTHRFYLTDITRRAAHTLTENEEKIVADAGPVMGAASNVFNMLSNADFPYPTITLSDGRSVKLDQAAFNDLRALPNRADREKVMAAFFTSLGAFGRTFGTTMNGEVQKLLFLSKTRKYNSALEVALDGPNIPEPVYHRLVDGVNRNLPTFHRYLRLRQRILGVDQLHYYDLYAPLVASVNLQYAPDAAEKLVLAAVAPLGVEYGSVIQRAFNERWIDLLPNDGKRSGAYSEGPLTMCTPTC